MEPRNRFQRMNSASLCSLAGRYDNPIPTRFLAPIDCLKISALGFKLCVRFLSLGRILSLYYLAGIAHGSEKWHLLHVVSGKWVYQKSESTSDMPSCQRCTARTDRVRCQARHIVSGSPVLKTWPQRTSTFQLAHQVLLPGIWTHVFWSELRRSNQRAS